jgi:hypothetical protein
MGGDTCPERQDVQREKNRRQKVYKVDGQVGQICA